MCRALRHSDTYVYSADLEDLETTQHRDEFIRCSITNPHSVDAAFNLVAKRFGSVDAVINCTYIRNPGYGKYHWDQTPISSMCSFINANLGSTLSMLQSCKLLGVENVILISSIYGEKVPEDWMYEGTNVIKTPLEYACTKAALNQMVRYLSKEMHINAIAPGGIESDDMDRQFKENYKGIAPFTKPESIGAMADFLISEKGEEINGQVITIDNGFSV